MKFPAILFILLIGFGAIAKDDVCKTTGSKNTVSAAPRSDWVGFCGFFAFRSNLHQFRCESEKKADCPAPSVIDLIVQSTKLSKFLGYRGPNYVTVGIEKADGVIDEECLKFSDVFPLPEEESEKLSYANNYQRQILKAFGPKFSLQEQRMLKSEDPCPEVYHLTEMERAKMYKELTDSIEEKILKELTDAVEKSGCPRKPLPKMTNVDQASDKPDQLLAKARKTLDEGHSLVLPLFIKQPDGGAKSPHAVMVSNYRTTCCGSVCTTEYQVIDSLGYYWTDHVDNWVNEDDLLQSLPDEPNAFNYIK